MGVFLFTVVPSPITLVLSPLALIKNPFFFVYLQTLWISITAIPIYFISLRKLKLEFLSLLISIIFLLFFGIAGLNWFDIHFQTLLLPLFTAGVCFFYYNRYKLAAVFLVLAGSVHFLFMIFPIYFYLLYSIESTVVNRRFVRPRLSMIIPAVLSVIFLIAGLYIEHLAFGSTFLVGPSHITIGANSTILSNLTKGPIDNEIQTFLLYLAPFMMLPLVSKRWFPPMLLFFFLLFFADNYVFYFPSVLRLTESAMLIPFLFLGTIDVLQQIGNTIKFEERDSLIENASKEKLDVKGTEEHRKVNLVLKFVIVIFILVILLDTVYQPYGLINKYSEADFGLDSVLDYNVTLYEVYSAIVNLIPQNDPFVLYQNNMPEVVYRDPSALTALVFGYSNNFTYPLGTDYRKPFWSSDIEYVIADPYSSYFLSGGSGNFSLNMYTTLRHFISEGGYGIEAEYDGLILLKKDFVGPPLVYGAEDRIFSAEQLYVSQYSNGLVNGSYYADGSIVTHNAIYGQTIWYGPYTFLQPGNYSLTLEVKASNTSSNNYFNLRFSYFDNENGIYTAGPILIDLANITGKDFPAQGKFVNITISITAQNFLEGVEFAGQNFHWNGNFWIRQITVSQISPLVNTS
ncbi:MAG: DUF2079 domain-containing protein [Thermoplasmatales archaeon]